METRFWKIENFSGNVINLLQDNAMRIYSDRLTMKQVSDMVGKRLRIARSFENPVFIASSYVEIDGTVYIDNRKSRGQQIKCYMIENN